MLETVLEWRRQTVDGEERERNHRTTVACWGQTQ